MTRVVAQVVYQLDVDELPLKKLEQQQNKNQAARGRSRSNIVNVTHNRRMTFSQGLLMKMNAGKSHPALHRHGSTKRERFLSGGSAIHTPTSHRSLNPAAELTADSQLGKMSKEPLLVDSTVSLTSETPTDRHSSTSSQQQQSLDGNIRRGSEPTATVEHPLLSQTCSAPMTSSNTPSPLPTHSPLVLAEHKPPWASNESPGGGNTPPSIEQQSTSAFVSPIQPSDNDFILANEHADTPSVHDNSPSGSRRTSETTPEPNKKHMTKAYSVDDTRHRILAIDTSSNRLLSSPDSFSSDILPDRRGSIKIRRTYGSVRREQPTVIHEEKGHTGEGSTAGDFCNRIIVMNCEPVRATITLYPIGIEIDLSPIRRHVQYVLLFFKVHCL